MVNIDGLGQRYKNESSLLLSWFHCQAFLVFVVVNPPPIPEPEFNGHPFSVGLFLDQHALERCQGRVAAKRKSDS